MKNLLLSFTVLSIIALGSVNAQVQKTPFVEHFTQASCGPCASQNPGMYTILNTFGSANYVKLTYQVSWPGTDPMNAEYPAGPSARTDLLWCSWRARLLLEWWSYFVYQVLL